MRYSEADTRSKFIDPKLYEQGWQEAHIVRERSFTDGRKLPGGNGKQSCSCAPSKQTKIKGLFPNLLLID